MVIGMGIDIQEIARFEQALKRRGKNFCQKTFTPQETAYCQGQKRPAQHFCGRFCAKEAFFKAMGTGWAKGIKWQEVEIIRQASGRPELKVYGQAAVWVKRARIKKIWLSLSHSQAYATAAVVLEG